MAGRRFPLGASIAVALVVLLAILSSGGRVYWSAPFGATVVDQTTGAPVAGARVLVGWDSYVPLRDALMLGTLGVAETVTDGEGRFRVPGWGPRFKVELAGKSEPRVYVFKPGYLPAALMNVSHPRDEAWVGAIRSEVDGTTIRLEPAGTDLGAYAKSMDRLNGGIDSMTLMTARSCYWTQAIGMVSAAGREHRRLKDLGWLAGTSLSVMEDVLKDDAHFTATCGLSPKQALAGG